MSDLHLPFSLDANSGMNIPDNMVQVSSKLFFEVMGPMNVHPSVFDSTDYTVWKMPTWYGATHDHIVGRSYPGWKNPGDAKEYYVRIDLLALLWNPKGK